MPSPRCLVNPPGAASVHLEGAQRAFEGWGNRNDFAWWFERRVGGPVADLLQVRDHETAVAGIAIVYRRVRRPSGEGALAGIMSAAWTHPAERRRGHFARLVDECHRVAADRGAQLLLSFIADERPSSDLLARVSEIVVPTWGLRDRSGTDAGAGREMKPLPPSEISLMELWRRFDTTARGLSFEYEPLSVFASQARLDQPGTVVLDMPDGNAIVQPVADGLQVHAVIARDAGGIARVVNELRATCGLSVRAFTTERAVADPLLATGMHGVPGRLFVSRLASHSLPAGEWALQAIDRA